MCASRVFSILILDSRDEGLHPLAEGVRDGSFAVRTVASLRDGLSLLKEAPVDVLILHGAAAAVRDHAVVRLVRQETAPDVPAIVVLGEGYTGEMAEAALAAGVTRCLFGAPSAQAVRTAVLDALRATNRLNAEDMDRLRWVGSSPVPHAADTADTPKHAGAPFAGPGASGNDLSGHQVQPSASGVQTRHVSSPGTQPRHLSQGAQAYASDLFPPSAGSPDALAERDAQDLLREGRSLVRQGALSRAAHLLAALIRFHGKAPELPEALGALADCFDGLGQAAKGFRFRHRAATAYAEAGRMREATAEVALLAHAPASLRQELGDPLVLAARHLAEKGQPGKAAQVLAVATGAASSAPAAGQDRHSSADTAFPSPDVAATTRPVRGGMVLQESPPENWEEKRQHPRIPLADYFVSLPHHDEVFSVMDISSGGIGFKAPSDMVKVGDSLRFAVLDSEGVRVKRVHAVVRFAEGDRIGCEFTDVSARQRAALDELICHECSRQGLTEAEEGGVDADAPGIRRDASGKIIIEVDW